MPSFFRIAQRVRQSIFAVLGIAAGIFASHSAWAVTAEDLNAQELSGLNAGQPTTTVTPPQAPATVRAPISHYVANSTADLNRQELMRITGQAAPTTSSPAPTSQPANTSPVAAGTFVGYTLADHQNVYRVGTPGRERLRYGNGQLLRQGTQFEVTNGDLRGMRAISGKKIFVAMDTDGSWAVPVDGQRYFPKVLRPDPAIINPPLTPTQTAELARPVTEAEKDLLIATVKAYDEAHAQVPATAQFAQQPAPLAPTSAPASTLTGMLNNYVPPTGISQRIVDNTTVTYVTGPVDDGELSASHGMKLSRPTAFNGRHIPIIGFNKG